MTLPVYHAIGGSLQRFGRDGVVTPPPPPPPPAGIVERFPGDPNATERGRIYFGSSREGNGDVTFHEQAAGAKLGAHRTFFNTTGQVNPPGGGLFQAVRDDHANNRWPWVSFKISDWPAAGTGASDFIFDGIIRELESYDKPTVVILNHEPENDNKPPADWRAMQARFRQRMNAYAFSNGPIQRIAFASCLMAYTWNRTSGRTPDDWWAGAGVHDFVTADHYTRPPESIVRQQLTLFMDWTEAKGVPFGVAEWGLKQYDTNGAAKMQAFFDAMTDGSRDCVGLTYWDSNSNQAAGEGFLLTGAMLTKYRQLLASPKAMHLSDLGY